MRLPFPVSFSETREIFAIKSFGDRSTGGLIFWKVFGSILVGGALALYNEDNKPMSHSNSDVFFIFDS